jgi:hypothetical protein
VQVRTYEASCGPLTQYGMKHMRAFSNICNAGIDTAQMSAAASKACAAIQCLSVPIAKTAICRTRLYLFFDEATLYSGPQAWNGELLHFSQPFDSPMYTRCKIFYARFTYEIHVQDSIPVLIFECKHRKKACYLYMIC